MLQGWSSGENPFKIELKNEAGDGDLGAPIDATMVVQLVPLGMLILGMGIATTDDPRIPEIARTVSLVWSAKLPGRLSLHPDPLSELGTQALAKFAHVAANAFSTACLQATQPAPQQRPALGNA
jgi:hypothetical protein